MSAPLAARCEVVLDAAGWNLRGVLTAARYDACVAPAFRCERLLPEARSVVVLGSGGRALWQAFRASPEYGMPGDPLDAMSERVAREAAQALSEPGLPAVALLAHRAREGSFADFVALGREAGLGAPGRLGLLLHPEYGPWLSLRAALLMARRLAPTPALAGFDPCRGCPAPCADACHGGAVPAHGFQVERCAAARAREPACRLRCDARRACVLGPSHAYESAAEAHHMGRAGVPPLR